MLASPGAARRFSSMPTMEERKSGRTERGSSDSELLDVIPYRSFVDPWSLSVVDGTASSEIDSRPPALQPSKLNDFFCTIFLAIALHDDKRMD
mmetsp:Transcript_19380/g.32131  ORF Transcript_19380/g.32131 Transcript_19380/m.32131 type:complete len:93 (+) Transcript_19380:306-584(+)